MSFAIIHTQSGVAVENLIPPSLVQRALAWWRSEGMSGQYEAVKEPHHRGTEITLAKFSTRNLAK